MSTNPLFRLRNIPAKQLVDIFGIEVHSLQNKSVQVGGVFTKTWQVMNLGSCPWKDMALECKENKLIPSLRIPHDKILIPDTLVGGIATISAVFKAPNYPCSASSEWQLVRKLEYGKNIHFDILCCSTDVLTGSLVVSGYG